MLYSIIPFVIRDLNIERSQRYTARKLFTNNSSRLPHNSCPLCTPAGRKQVYKSGGTDQSESSNQTIYSRLTCSTLYLFVSQSDFTVNLFWWLKTPHWWLCQFESYTNNNTNIPFLLINSTYIVYFRFGSLHAKLELEAIRNIFHEN